MAEGFKKFEEIIAWQKARELNREIYRWSKDGAIAKDFGLRDQVRRSSVSIMANIAEGFERGRSTEFHQYLSTAKASCAETRSHLYVALDAGYLSDDEFKTLLEKAEEVGRVVGGLRAALKR